MRKPFIAGNWKMNLTRAECVDLATAVAVGAGAVSADLAVCPAFVYLESVSAVLSGSKIGVGAQNAYHQAGGAYTGEISCGMLVDIGCRYVILGHSERRHILGESNEDVNKKVVAVLAAGLIPIICVGETLDERESGKTREVVQSQFDGSLKGISAEEFAKCVVAYEPVWAIGTGKVASPEQAEEVHLDLRNLMGNRYNLEVAAKVRIQYGGSVKPSNASELLSQPNIDGALVGGASLNAADFLAIAAAAK